MRVEYKIFGIASDIIFVVLLLVSSIFALSYLSSDNIFDAEITYINNIKAPYSFLFNIDPKINETLVYSVRVIYDRQDLLIGESTFECNNKCEQKIDISKVFFDKYTVFITTQYEGKIYQKQLSFNLEEPPALFNVDLKPVFIFNPGEEIVISGNISFDFADPDNNYYIELYPKNEPSLKKIFPLNCYEKCMFELPLTSITILGDYYMDIHTATGVLQKSFKIVLKDDIVSKPKPDSKSTIYNSQKEQIDSQVTISKNGKIYDKFNSANKEQNSYKEKGNIKFEFTTGKVKSIKVPNAKFDEISIGYEELPLDRVQKYGFDVNNAFAIDPHFSEDISEFEVTFIATANSVYKCVDYDFENQNCYGEFVWLMDTIPGKEYTITLLPYDPIFLQVSNYLLSPIDGECQSQGGGWALANCQDSSLSGSKSCPAGASGEATFCYDNTTEQHTVKRDFPGGVRMSFKDTSQDRCYNITKVEVIHKTSWSDNVGTRTIGISRNGSSWTTVVTGPALSPTSDSVTDVTSSLTSDWQCEDFFSNSSNASIQALWSVTGGNPNEVYTMDVDTLIYRITYDYEALPIITDKTTYQQGELVLIDGSEVWDPSANVSMNITRPDSVVDDLGTFTANSTNEFNTTYQLQDYGPIGTYTISAQQDNDSSINDEYNFTVVKRTPTVYTSKNFFAPGETADFTGTKWVKNDTIVVEMFFPSGMKSPTFSDNFTSSSSGTFTYNHAIANDLTLETGMYKFNFTENTNNTYYDDAGYTLIFRPSSSSISLDLINTSDGSTYNLGGAGGTQTFTAGFPQTLPSSGATLDSFEVNIRYSTSGSTTRVIEWYNSTSATYQVVCNVPDSASISTYTCDMTNEAQYLNSFNNLNIRLREEGGPSIHWYTDFIYVTRDFTILPPVVTAISPDNQSNYNTQFLIDFDYNVTSTFFNMSHCEFYINETLNQTDNSITNDITQTFSLLSFLDEGLYSWKVSCVEDSTKLQRGNSSIYYFTIDLTSPEATLISPADNHTTGINTASFLANFTDNFELENATLYIWNQTGSLIGTNTSLISGTTNSTTLDFTLTNQGIYYWNYLVYDEAGNYNWSDSNYTITFDFTPPSVSLNSPLNQSRTNISTHMFSANFTDNLGLKNATLYIWDFLGNPIGTNTTTISGSTNSSNLSFTLPAEGIYYWNYLVYDEAGNFNWSDSNYTIILDITKPNVTLLNPTNSSYGGYEQFFIGNYTDNYYLKNATLYIWDDIGNPIGTNTTTISGLSNTTNLSFTFASEGIYHWNYLVYDEAGNFNWADANFTLIIDLTPPQINLMNPLNNTAINVSTYTFSANFTDAVMLFNSTLRIWDELGNPIGTNTTTISGTTNSTFLNFTLPAEGIYYWGYSACDLVGNCNNSENRSIFVDFTPPNVTFVPITDGNNTFVNRSWTYINTTVYDLSLDSVILEWMGTDYPFACSGIVPNYNCSYNMSMLKNGLYTYRVYANDTLGNDNYTTLRSININKTIPEITIINPGLILKFSHNDSINLNITTLIEAQDAWFELNSNGTNVSMSQSSLLNWNYTLTNLTAGINNITFYAIDEVGNIANASILFYVTPQKHIKVSKTLYSSAEQEMTHIFKIENLGKWEEYALYDVVKDPWTYTDPLSLFGSNPILSATLLRRNFSIAKYSIEELNLTTNLPAGSIYSSNFMFAID